MTISRVNVRITINLDLAVLHAVNGFCGNGILDRVVACEATNFLVAGGLFLALWWWIWFTPEPDRRAAHRRVIVIAIVGPVLARALNRALADTSPYRLRPMYAPGSVSRRCHSILTLSTGVRFRVMPRIGSRFPMVCIAATDRSVLLRCFIRRSGWA